MKAVAINKFAKFRRKVKAECIDAYGGCCRDCGEADPAVLCVNGRGATNRHGADLYRYLLRSELYRDYTLRCFNCTRGAA